MIPVITTEIRQSIINNYLTQAVSGFLIYKPDLGMNDSPSREEFQRRRDLTMQDAVDYEIGGPSLNGYRRYIVEPELIQYRDQTKITYRVEFQAQGGEIGPFSHVCIARGTNILNLDISTGNNRGDYLGDLILSAPVSSRSEEGLRLEDPEIYRAELVLVVSNDLL